MNATRAILCASGEIKMVKNFFTSSSLATGADMDTVLVATATSEVLMRRGLQTREVGRGKIVYLGKSEAKGRLIYLRMHIAERFTKFMLACDILPKETRSCPANSEYEIMP
jgi:hypothetical protein